MAASIGSSVDRQLDVTDSGFDAHLALNSDNVLLPFPNIKPLNNIDEYASTIRSKKRETVHQSQAQSAQEKRRLRTAHVQNRNPKNEPVLSMAHGHRSNVLSYMNKQSLKGPLSVLARCLNEKTRIKVWTRSATKLRGACTGFILAFDRHWNMALSDIDEVYVLPKLVKMPVLPVPGEHGVNPTPAASLDKEARKESRVRHRHVNQMFIRGDNIVFVSIPSL